MAFARSGTIVIATLLLLGACGDRSMTASKAPPPSTTTDAAPPPPPAPAADAASEFIVTGSQRAFRLSEPSRLKMMAPAYVPAPADRERYQKNATNPVQRVAENPVSTFAVDVDTASYANVRRYLVAGQAPPRNAVRVEEMINYFRYDYPLPTDHRTPFAVTTDVSRTPWNPDTRLLRVALRGHDVARSERPAANLVFLIDVSGSMNEPTKLPLVQSTLRRLTERLRGDDRVAIVVYAGAAGLVLPSTGDKAQILAAIENLRAGGSTAGGEGLKLAYATARAHFLKDGINRVLLATDGDFNVGITSDERLKDIVTAEKESGITLTTLGFGTGNYNDAMMETIADAGNGNAAYIDTALEADKVLGEELSSTLFTIAGDVKIQVEFNPRAVAEYRLIGYENRALKEEDFANDKVDAGDIGSGHRVTALYEIALVGSPGLRLPERRYAANRPAVAPGPADELAVVKLRYKLPGESKSRLIERPLPAALAANAAAPGGDFAFAAAVAAFGQKLAGSKYLGDFGYRQIAALAGDSRDFSRAEFVKLVGLAGSGAPAAAAP